DYRGRKLGALGDAGVYAFYPNKQITTGEGGMIVTDRDDVAACVASLRDQGRDPEKLNLFADLGYNYRLPEMACALGEEQMKRLDAILARREEVARLYHCRLAGMEDLVLPDLDDPEGKISWFVYVVRLFPRFTAADRDWIARELQARGIGCGRYFPPIHLQPFYRRTFGCQPGDFPVAEAAAERTLALPFFNRLTEAQVDEVCSVLAGLCATRRKGKPVAPFAR
ncbi:MAG: DegT/DnrJ/EryC1/StrS family aminotransferase, partial [Acidobacteria bacterium]|nr:DegT/DnrJ/EryC1/StrS family aminotransferase [Acidobacteriota bacterium]